MEDDLNLQAVALLCIMEEQLCLHTLLLYHIFTQLLSSLSGG